MRTKCMALLAGALLMAGSLCAQAQSRVNDKKADRPRWTEEEIMERRAESMAAKLMLDDKTEAEFVSLYAQYLKELKDCREHYRETAPGPKDGKVGEPRKPLTDAEIEARMERRFEKQRQLLDIHKEKSRTYVFKTEAYNRLLYQRVKKTLWKIVHNLPKDYDDIKRWYYPKDFHTMLPHAIFLKALLIIAKSRGQKINGEAIKDILTAKLIDLDHYQQFEPLEKPLKQEHSWFALSDNPFLE